MFSNRDAIVRLMQPRYPATRLISLGSVLITGDSAHDFAEFFTGWTIEHGFEGVYYRYLIFAKKKGEAWSSARVFTMGRYQLGVSAVQLNSSRQRAKRSNSLSSRNEKA